MRMLIDYDGNVVDRLETNVGFWREASAYKMLYLEGRGREMHTEFELIDEKEECSSTCIMKVWSGPDEKSFVPQCHTRSSSREIERGR